MYSTFAFMHPIVYHEEVIDIQSIYISNVKFCQDHEALRNKGVTGS